jgi:hypothetical protein
MPDLTPIQPIAAIIGALITAAVSALVTYSLVAKRKTVTFWVSESEDVTLPLRRHHNDIVFKVSGREFLNLNRTEGWILTRSATPWGARAHQGKIGFSCPRRRLPLHSEDAKAAPRKGKSSRFKALDVALRVGIQGTRRSRRFIRRTPIRAENLLHRGQRDAAVCQGKWTFAPAPARPGSTPGDMVRPVSIISGSSTLLGTPIFAAGKRTEASRCDLR